ncbi:MAG: CoA-binding protein [Spirochaetaceae bacterium]
METVAVLGASNKEDRYSNMAVKLLTSYKHDVLPVHPTISEIDGIKVYSDLDSIKDKVDTLSLYLNPKYVDANLDGIFRLKPKRVIFNPGTESAHAIKSLKDEGIDVVIGCTLVMLKTDQF